VASGVADADLPTLLAGADVAKGQHVPFSAILPPFFGRFAVGSIELSAKSA